MKLEKALKKTMDSTPCVVQTRKSDNDPVSSCYVDWEAWKADNRPSDWFRVELGPIIVT